MFRDSGAPVVVDPQRRRGVDYLARHAFSLTPAAAGLSFGLLVTNLLYINQFPDRSADLQAGKHHWVARLPVQPARWGYLLIVALAYGALPLLVVGGILPWPVLLGWLFGRRSMTLRLRTEPAASQARYLSDLDRLITVEKSSFVNALSKILDEDQSGVEFYLVIAALLRRRGEVEYAIECHQTLLNRFAVDSPLHGELIFELAKDYIHAGLHDRAELLLNDLVERYPVLRIAAMEALLELHQGSREWHEAIAVGARMRTLLRSPALLLDAKNQQRLVAPFPQTPPCFF